MEFAQGAVPAPVTVDGKPAAAVDVLAVDALGGHRQIPLPVQTEQVRALPHVAEGLRGGQGVDVGPAELVGAFQHQHFALVLQRAGTQHHVVPAFVGEHLGVPHMAGEPGGVVAVSQQALLAVEGHAVLADGQADVVPAALFDVIKIAGVLDVAGVVEVHGAILHQG